VRELREMVPSAGDPVRGSRQRLALRVKQPQVPRDAG